MPTTILDGLALVDATGRAILASTLGTLVGAIAANLYARGRYAALARDLEENGARGRFEHPLLDAVVRSAEDAAKRTATPSTQAIVEERFQVGLGPLLSLERFVRAATGLVIILGLLGTFYGLTSSIGRLVDLVAGSPGGAADVSLGVTTGLTQALSGMAVAFSNSLVGIGSAVVLTVLGVASNVTDRRVALMLSLETYLDRLFADARPAPSPSREEPALAAAQRFESSVERLEATVAQFDSALRAFATTTRDFREFNAHLKDNVQRMSLSFGDLNDALKDQISSLKRNGH